METQLHGRVSGNKMSVRYDQFRFASVPRSGTTWFLAACEEAGLGKRYKATVHEPFNASDGNIFKLSLIRHPYNWLVSYFKAIAPGMTGVPVVDKLSFSVDGWYTEGDFPSFVSLYLNECPGQVGRIFESYGADSYLRIEDMPWAATEFFASLGIEPWLRNRCRSMAPTNTSKGIIYKDPKLYQLVMEAEKEMCERYDYY